MQKLIITLAFLIHSISSIKHGSILLTSDFEHKKLGPLLSSCPYSDCDQNGANNIKKISRLGVPLPKTGKYAYVPNSHGFSCLETKFLALHQQPSFLEMEILTDKIEHSKVKIEVVIRSKNGDTKIINVHPHRKQKWETLTVILPLHHKRSQVKIEIRFFLKNVKMLLNWVKIRCHRNRPSTPKPCTSTTKSTSPSSTTTEESSTSSSTTILYSDTTTTTEPTTTTTVTTTTIKTTTTPESTTPTTPNSTPLTTPKSTTTPQTTVVISPIYG